MQKVVGSSPISRFGKVAANERDFVESWPRRLARSRPASPSPAAASLAEPLLTCQEAAELLSVKPARIYAAGRSGRLTCVLVGRNVRLLRSDLEHFVAQQRTHTAHNATR